MANTGNFFPKSILGENYGEDVVIEQKEMRDEQKRTTKPEKEERKREKERKMSERGLRKEEEREGKTGIKDERTKRKAINRGHRGQN